MMNDEFQGAGYSQNIGIGLRSSYITTSPRTIIFETIKEITKLVDALFEDGSTYKFRFRSFQGDPPEANWSAMLRWK
jgi:hypothetical protein